MLYVVGWISRSDSRSLSCFLFVMIWSENRKRKMKHGEIGTITNTRSSHRYNRQDISRTSFPMSIINRWLKYLLVDYQAIHSSPHLIESGCRISTTCSSRLTLRDDDDDVICFASPDFDVTSARITMTSNSNTTSYSWRTTLIPDIHFLYRTTVSSSRSLVDYDEFAPL